MSVLIWNHWGHFHTSDLTVYAKPIFQPWWQVLVIGERSGNPYRTIRQLASDYPFNSNSPLSTYSEFLLQSVVIIFFVPSLFAILAVISA